MDSHSKLPKLKRPATGAPSVSGVRTILPLDRFKESTATTNAFRYQNANGPPTKVKKYGSPELVSNSRTARSKLRRSQSMCEINTDKYKLNQILETIHSPPNHSSKTITSNFVNRSKLRKSRSACDINLNKKSTKNTNTTKISNIIVPQKFNKVPLKQRPENLPSNRFKVKDVKGKTTVTTKTMSTSNQENPVEVCNIKKTFSVVLNKKIPAYDYKARFNDLLEKHKVLVNKINEYVEKLSSLDNLPQLYEENKKKNVELEQALKEENDKRLRFESENNENKKKLMATTASLKLTKQKLNDVANENISLKASNESNEKDISILREKNKEILEKNQFLVSDLEASEEQLYNSNIERKDLHNTIMDLRGNIRVFCRVRPALEFENDRLLCDWNYLDECSLEITNPEYIAGGTRKQASHQFSFDHVFHQRSTQDDIFEMVSPLIQSALDGFNICIFAYGQTGSGKTYTMDGTTEKLGVIPRTVDLLFDSIRSYKRLGWTYQIKASFLEIYNEVIYDLLSKEQKTMEIRMAKNKKDIYVSNIIEEAVESADHLKKLMQMAKLNRATACTVNNERSSRSHAVTKLELTGCHLGKNETSVGAINLVDLAGSESAKTSKRMNETKNINRSLSELSNVIFALLQKAEHIPYRNSKLTHLLMPSLGGNSKTLMFINVSPFQDCFVESTNSLRFAASVNSCKMTKVKKNKFLNASSNI